MIIIFALAIIRLKSHWNEGNAFVEITTISLVLLRLIFILVCKHANNDLAIVTDDQPNEKKW